MRIAPVSSDVAYLSVSSNCFCVQIANHGMEILNYSKSLISTWEIICQQAGRFHEFPFLHGFSPDVLWRLVKQLSLP